MFSRTNKHHIFRPRSNKTRMFLPKEILYIIYLYFQFCQPAGWYLSSQRQQSSYFVSVLTDIDADRHYCACLTFYEPVAMTTKPDDEDLDDQEVIIPHHSQMFAPKTLVLITQHDYFETFRVSL